MLQVNGVPSKEAVGYFVDSKEPTIKELKEGFEAHGIKDSKALLLARYLIEPRTSGKVSYSEDLKSSTLSKSLTTFIGAYKLYTPDETFMHLSSCIKSLFKIRDTLKESL